MSEKDAPFELTNSDRIYDTLTHQESISMG